MNYHRFKRFRCLMVPCLTFVMTVSGSISQSFATTIPAASDGTIRYFPQDWDPAANGGSGGPTAWNNSGLADPRWAISPTADAGQVVGTAGTAGSNRYVGVHEIFFALPARPAGHVVDSSSSLEVFLISRMNVPTFNVDVWGLGYQSTTTYQTSHFPDFDGDNDPGAGASTSLNGTTQVTGGIPVNRRIIHFSDSVDLGAGLGITSRMKVFDNLFTPTSAINTAHTGSGASLAAFLNAIYDAGATAGDYAVFRLNPDSNLTPSTDNIRYNLGTQDRPAAGARPAQLTIDFVAVPEPTTLALLTGCVGLLATRRKF